jgi:hypothetical protein
MPTLMPTGAAPSGLIVSSELTRMAYSGRFSDVTVLSTPDITAEHSAGRRVRIREIEERLMDVVSALVAHLRPPEAVQPR